jgi:hypothetical protein
MARRKPKTLRYKAGKLIASTSKAAKQKVKRSQRALKKRLKTASKNIARQKRRAQRSLKSKSRYLARETNRQRKRALRQAKKIQRTLRRSGKRRVRELRRFAKKTTKEARRARRLVARKVNSGRKAASRFFKNRKRAAKIRERQRKAVAIQQRREARAQQRARTQIDLTGTADISTARITQAGADPGASKPGEPPKLRTGKGRSAIKAQLRLKGQKLESRVYVDKKIAPYMAMWEFRKDGKGRPFLKPSVENNKDQFGKIIGSELKQANKGGRKKAVVK